jgi:HAD superfamily hydrolase (TIGR01484 family)
MKLLVADFDGTLSKNHITVSKKNREMIKKWKAAGNHFAVATGRAVHLLKPILDSHKIEYDYLICCNGSSIHSRSETLQESYLPVKLNDIEDVMNLNEVESVIVITDKGIHYQTNTNNWSAFKYRTRMRYYSLRRPFINKESADNLVQVTLRTHTVEGAKYATELLNKLDYDINPTTNKTYVDIVAGTNTKASAIEMVNEIENYEEIHTIGDENNDYDMIKSFNGYYINGGNERLKEVAITSFDEVEGLITHLLKGE